MTDEHHPRAFRPFEDGHRLTYTIREIYDTKGEFQSQHHDLAAAADAFVLACREASSVELRDVTGRLLASVQGGAP